MIKGRLLVAGLTCLLAFTAYPARAQEPMSERKRTLILEIVRIFNQQSSPGDIVDAMLRQMQASFPQMLSDLTTSAPDLTEPQRKEIEQKAAERFDHFASRFREEVGRQIDFQKYQEDLLLALYDKYFTESEIEDLIAYYRSPTGQKMLRVMPQLAADSIKQGAEQLGPQITRISQQILQEEFNDLKAEPDNKRTGQDTPHN